MARRNDLNRFYTYFHVLLLPASHSLVCPTPCSSVRLCARARPAGRGRSARQWRSFEQRAEGRRHRERHGSPPLPPVDVYTKQVKIAILTRGCDLSRGTLAGAGGRGGGGKGLAQPTSPRPHHLAAGGRAGCAGAAGVDRNDSRRGSSLWLYRGETIPGRCQEFRQNAYHMSWPIGRSRWDGQYAASTRCGMWRGGGVGDRDRDGERGDSDEFRRRPLLVDVVICLPFCPPAWIFSALGTSTTGTAYRRHACVRTRGGWVYRGSRGAQILRRP